MSGPENNVNVEQLLFVVEAAQRAGLSEGDIAQLVEDAIGADAELERAA
jgi:hypothetical protein